MKNSDFAHLHIHTDHSSLDGFGSPKKYAEKAKELGYQYLTITDHGNVDGAIEFQKQCRVVDIKPIFGCELYVVPDLKQKEKGEKRGHLTVLVESLAGWQTLCKWLTIANIDGFYHRPRIDFKNILDSDLTGLVFMTACAASVLNLKGAESFIDDLYEKTDGSIYCEIMPHDIPVQKKIHDLIKSKYDDLRMVATNDCHYPNKDDWEAQEILLAIQSNKTWNDPNRWSFGFKGLHLRTADEMLVAFNKQGHFNRKEVIEAMENALIIAQRCSGFEIKKQEISLPELPYEIKDKTEFDYLYEGCIEQLKKLNLHNEKYLDRFDFESDLIYDKNFSRYFLLVQNFIQECRKRGWGIGPGRGSVGGSLIAFLMGITQIDPIKYNLSFSRFLSENRVDWPDIDIDVEKRYRQEAVDYLYQTYGNNRVCGISTDMRLKGKAVIRDLGRIFEIPNYDIAPMAGSIWDNNKEDGSTIKFALNHSRESEEFQEKYPDIIKHALKLEGTIRGYGRHAAGIVISGDDLTTGSRCVLSRRSGDNIAANWNMENAEYCGLMKLDVLGLATISVLKEAEYLINQRENTCFWYHPESDSYFFDDDLNTIYANGQCEQIDFKLELIPENDKDVFKLISDGKTAGLFQVSARPLTELCVEMGIETFSHIRDALALVRPGPKDSGMTAQYIERKHGEKYKSIHPIHDEITKDTYGVLFLQEQIMQVISRMAGMSESDADYVRKIIAKKRDPEELEKYRKEFIDGCIKQKTFSEDQANQFWEDLGGWARYGFGAAHATAYALICYQTAYLKAHYPVEFFCATLTYSEFNEKSRDQNKHKQYIIDEAIELGLSIMPPKKGISKALNWVAKNNSLYAPFVELNGIGESSAVDCIESKSCSKIKNKGFFNIDPVPKKETKIDKILIDIEADNSESIPESVDQYLSFKCYKQSEKSIRNNKRNSSRSRDKFKSKQEYKKGTKLKCKICDNVIRYDGINWNHIGIKPDHKARI